MKRNISHFLNESLFGKPLTEPRFIIPSGLKPWMSTINKALKLVPSGSIPDVIVSVRQLKNTTGYKMAGRKGFSPFAVSLVRDKINIPNDLVSADELKASQDFSMYKNDDAAWERIREMSKTVPISSFSYGKFTPDFKIIAFDTTKFKTPAVLTAHKERVNDTYFEKNNKYWHVNKTALGTVVHELGHVYDNNKNLSGGAEWTNLAQRWYKEGAPDYCQPKNDPNSFSQGTYGEAFAEAFSNYIVLKGKDLPDYILDYMRKNIK